MNASNIMTPYRCEMEDKKAKLMYFTYFLNNWSTEYIYKPFLQSQKDTGVIFYVKTT